MSNSSNAYERCIIVIVTCTNLCVIFRTVTRRQLQLVYVISMTTYIKYLSLKKNHHIPCTNYPLPMWTWTSNKSHERKTTAYEIRCVGNCKQDQKRLVQKRQHNIYDGTRQLSHRQNKEQNGCHDATKSVDSTRI